MNSDRPHDRAAIVWAIGALQAGTAVNELLTSWFAAPPLAGAS
jgi:hypothetical protein